MQQKRLMYLTFEYIISIFNNPPSLLKKNQTSFPSPNILCIPSARFRHILKKINKKKDLLRSAQQ